MKRVYSNYSDEDYSLVSQKARELGFSPSSFQHYCVMLSLGKRGNTLPIDELLAKMRQNLEKVEPESSFIVSALLPEEWPSLSRSEKMTIAKQLSAMIHRDPHKRFEAVSAAGKVTIYKRKEITALKGPADQMLGEEAQ